MPFASLRTRALILSAGVATAVIVPLGSASVASAATTTTTSTETTTTTTSTGASTTTAPTAAEIAAAKKAAAKAKKAAAKKAAKKKAAAKKRAKKLAKKRAAHRKKLRQLKRGKKIVRVAARYKGTPYRYGASGPGAFDCSGFTSFVARKAVGVSLPHNAAAQAHSGKVKKIKRAKRQVGDLIFFHRGGGIPHVAIYAGHGKMWDAPHSGSWVHKHSIYTSAVSYGRIGA